MVDTLELAEHFPDSSILAAEIAADAPCESIERGLQQENTVLNARCLWCDRHFTPRATGGSLQKFCCTEHRQQFWIAARRWTMRAIEVGLLSVDCLKASHASVHAV
jgi:hypothetical protein